MNTNKLKKVSEYSAEKLKENSSVLQRGLMDLGIVPDSQVDLNNIWLRFEGKANTKEILAEKARSLAQLICVSTFKDVEIIFNQLEKSEKLEIKPDLEIAAIFRKLFQEFILFYMHFTDRLAFSYLQADEREFFADALFVETRNLLTNALMHSFDSQEQEAKFFNEFGDIYNQRQMEYGAFKKMVADKGEPLGQTLFWEFEKKISQIIETEIGSTEFKMVIMLYVHSIVLDSIALLQINSLFKS